MMTFNYKLYRLFQELGYPGVVVLFKEAKRRGIAVTLDQVKEFHAKQFVSSIHGFKRARYKRPPVIVGSPYEQLSLDLMFLPQLFKWNRPYIGVLVAANPFSKMIYVSKIKSKQASEIIRALSDILSQAKFVPRTIATDLGKTLWYRILYTHNNRLCFLQVESFCQSK